MHKFKYRITIQYTLGVKNTLGNPAKNTWQKIKNLLFTSDTYIIPKNSIVVPDGKNKKIIDISECSTITYIGRVISEPINRKVSPKGDCPLSITLPEIAKEIMNPDAQTQITPVKLTNGQVIIVLSTPPHNGDEKAC